MPKTFFALPLALVSLSGCISTVGTIVTAPVKVASKAADWATTSQSEADRNYGRKMRHQEAREGQARRQWAKYCKKAPDAPDCRQYAGYRAGY